MSITFDQIPRDTLNPGGYLEFDQSLAGSLSDPAKILLIGQKIGGTQAELHITRISTLNDAIAKFGQDSILVDCVKFALKTNQGSELYAVACTQTEIPELIEAMGDDRYDYIMSPYYDTASLHSFATELDRRWNAMVARESRLFVAVPLGYDDALALASGLNSPHINLLPIGVGTPDPAHRWATILTCVMADKLNNDPAAPETDIKLPYLTAPSTEFTTRQRNDLAHNGCGTWATNVDVVQIKYLVTTYRFNPQGEKDSAYRDIQVAEVLKRWRRYINYIAMRTYAGYKIAKDASLYGSGQKILDPDEFAGFLQTQYLNYGMREKGWFDDFNRYRNTLIVEIDPDNQDRINYVGQPTIIGQFRVLAGKDRFVTY